MQPAPLHRGYTPRPGEFVERGGGGDGNNDSNGGGNGGDGGNGVFSGEVTAAGYSTRGTPHAAAYGAQRPGMPQQPQVGRCKQCKLNPG